MPATTVSAANTRVANYNETSFDIEDSRPAKRSRTETVATTTRVEDWVQDVVDVNDNTDATSEFSASTMWRP